MCIVPFLLLSVSAIILVLVALGFGKIFCPRQLNFSDNFHWYRIFYHFILLANIEPTRMRFSSCGSCLEADMLRLNNPLSLLPPPPFMSGHSLANAGRSGYSIALRTEYNVCGLDCRWAFNLGYSVLRTPAILILRKSSLENKSTSAGAKTRSQKHRRSWTPFRRASSRSLLSWSWDDPSGLPYTYIPSVRDRQYSQLPMSYGHKEHYPHSEVFTCMNHERKLISPIVSFPAFSKGPER